MKNFESCFLISSLVLAFGFCAFYPEKDTMDGTPKQEYFNRDPATEKKVLRVDSIAIPDYFFNTFLEKNNGSAPQFQGKFEAIKTVIK